MPDAHKVGDLTLRAEVIKGCETGRWFVDIPSSITSTGRRVRKRFASRKEAEAVAKDVARELKFRNLGFWKKPKRSNLSFTDAADQWVKSKQLEADIHTLSRSTLRTIEIRIKPLKAFFRNTDVADILSEDVVRYQRDRIGAKRKGITVNGEVRVLRQMFGWLLEKGHIDALPKFKRAGEEYRRFTIPSPEEVVALLNQLPQVNRVLIRLLAETGMRPSEALNLPWAHVEEADYRIRIEPYGSWRPKTQVSRRLVPLNAGLMKELLSLPRRGAYVFAGKNPSRPLQNIRASLATAAKACGLQPPPLKLFRKAFASWQAEKGLHPRLLQELMGHAPGSKVTDQHYVFASEAAMRRAGIALPIAEDAA